MAAERVDLSQEGPFAGISVIIPTYRREEVLADTIEALLGIVQPGAEIILVDQTPVHRQPVEERLAGWNDDRAIRWLRRSHPSIPGSMNTGAAEARGDILLFLDDDILPDKGLMRAHVQAHAAGRGDLVAGRVLQPWHHDGHGSDPFTRTEGEFKMEFMGGNFSIRRERLLALGGFDENFKGAAYRFEREFADRLLDAGGTIWYEPAALIRHLHHGSGGTRSRGDHLTSWNPRHPVGAYYYLMTSPRVRGRARQALSRLFRSAATRHHLRRPWYIPVTLVSELTGFAWALGLVMSGPKLPLRAEARRPA